MKGKITERTAEDIYAKAIAKFQGIELEDKEHE
jgi:hypothetical protein